MSRRDDIADLLNRHEPDWARNQCACGVRDEDEVHRDHLVVVIDQFVHDEFEMAIEFVAAKFEEHKP